MADIDMVKKDVVKRGIEVLGDKNLKGQAPQFKMIKFIG